MKKISWKPKKLIFVGLLSLSCFVLTALAFLLWWVPYIGLSSIHPYLPFLFGASLGIIILTILTGIVLLTSSVVLEREVFFSHALRGAVIKIVLPILVFIGRLLGISKKKIQQSFVEINNQLVLSKPFKIKPDKLLLLMPHCLQNNECDVRITGDAQKCKRCGKCGIKELVELADDYHVELSVATGGTIARRIVVEKRPELIIAVACERDLTSGIQDSYPIPVYGILNERPFGPCFNTQVDMTKVKKAMKAVLNTHMQVFNAIIHCSGPEPHNPCNKEEKR